jgi:hypothetical protein
MEIRYAETKEKIDLTHPAYPKFVTEEAKANYIAMIAAVASGKVVEVIEKEQEQESTT